MTIREFAGAGLFCAICSLAICGGEMTSPYAGMAEELQPAAPQPLAGPSAAPPVVVPSGPYEEYFAYSAHVRRSYVPGYTPHVTSIFENPRTYPKVLCVMGTPYYQYAGLAGWFFGSPRGYQSSVPKNSHALAYFRGELGITSRLQHGYPEGLRVVEPVIVPFGSSTKKGGVLIASEGGEDVYSAPEQRPWFPEKGERAPEVTQEEIIAIPTPTPAPSITPLPAPGSGLPAR